MSAINMARCVALASAFIAAVNGQAAMPNGCPARITSISEAQVASLSAELRSTFTIGVIRGRAPIEAGDVVGAVVRLSFHDAAAYDQNAADSFGADGCVDMNDPGNGGLQETLDLLDEMWAPHCQIISRADYWMLAAKIAIEVTTLDDNTYQLPIRFGRTTVDTCVSMSNGQSRLPSAEGDRSEIQRTFVDQMGLTMADAVTLLGAHTLGRCELDNSGYNGPWTRTPHVFNNDFYVELIDEPWRRTQAVVEGATKTSWLDGPRIMLNTDMDIGFDISEAPPAGMGNPSICGPVGSPMNRCSTNSDIEQQSIRYSNDQNAWLQDFRGAFQRMAEVGYEGELFNAGAAPAAPTPGPTPAPTPAPSTTEPTPSPTPSPSGATVTAEPTPSPTPSPSGATVTSSPITSAPTPPPTVRRPRPPMGGDGMGGGGGGMGGMGGMGGRQ